MGKPMTAYGPCTRCERRSGDLVQVDGPDGREWLCEGCYEELETERENERSENDET